MRILIRTSKWAIWSRRLGALALPLAVIPILLHRAALLIDSDTFVVIEAVAVALAALAVLAAVVAYARLWVSGDRVWWRATVGLAFGLVCLAPAAYVGYAAFSQPDMPDVSTDYVDPPPLVTFVPARFIGPQERARIAAAYPNARSRTYPIAAPELFDIVSGMVDDLGWEPRSHREPLDAGDTGQINAVATTLLGWRQEVAIRVSGNAEGSTVAMRSASLTHFHDLGENGRRVESFLLDLDQQVTLALRNAPPPDTGEDDN
jgi:hypothetical protein